jgi:hypothetical protein
VPDLDGYPTGSIQHMPTEIWTDALNSHLISTLSLTKAFFPLLIDQQARVLVLTPNVVAPLAPVLNGVETLVVNSLQGFTDTLRRELGAYGSKVVQLKLGDIDLGASSTPTTSTGSPTKTASSGPRGLYGPASIMRPIGWSKAPSTGSKLKGSHAKELHHTVFDALTLKSPCRTYRVGRGSLIYEMVGRWMPNLLVEPMLKSEIALASEFPSTTRKALEGGEGWEKMEESVLVQ